MKIAVIIGSLRRDSYNRKVFEEYKRLFSNAEFTEVSITDFPLYSEEIEKVAIPDVVNQAAAILKASQAILVFSPEYNYSIPGVLKNALDWLSRVKESPFAKKPAAILGASPGKLGTARMQYDFRKVAVTLDLNMLNKPEIMVGEVHKLFGEDGKLKDDKTRDVLKKHIDAFVAHVKL